MAKKEEERNRDIYLLYKNGMQMSKIAREYGISHTRVKQLVDNGYYHDYGKSRTPSALHTRRP